MSLQYTITCSAMNDRDVAVIKSLLGIIGKVGGADWSYSDDPGADVVIVDVEEGGVGSLKAHKNKRALVVYASPDKTLIPNTFMLNKPARARDLIDVLTAIQNRLVAG
ncbi:MAG: hypothetical protein K0R03_1153 [Moraxellaceae bacterium]|jgi:hypothetical protein|nr:hypothetical protein [Moraxellaceae bacterium]